MGAARHRRPVVVGDQVATSRSPTESHRRARDHRARPLGTGRPGGRELDLPHRPAVKCAASAVELGRSSALCRHPAVRAAWSRRRRCDSVGESLVATCRRRRRAPMPPLPPIEELRSFLQETLPDYMCRRSRPARPCRCRERQGRPPACRARAGPPRLAHARIARATRRASWRIWSEVCASPRWGSPTTSRPGRRLDPLPPVVARATSGLPLTPRQAFEHQTIRSWPRPRDERG